MAEQFDVFMCHNSDDKPAVRELALKLREQGIQPWLDECELRPGLDWQVALDAQIKQIKTAAVFVGEAGIGPWQNQELQGFLSEFVERGCPVIPVLLPNASKKPDLPRFLRGKTFVDFRKEVPEPFGRLVWGITGVKPAEIPSAPVGADDKVVDPVLTTRDIETAASFEESYLACQATECQALRSEGIAPIGGIFVPMLQDVFVPLELDLSASAPGYRAIELLGGLSRSFSIWDFLARAQDEATFRQLAILAWGGYGKTTLLKHIAYRMGTKQPENTVPQMVPFLLVLRGYRSLLTQENPPSLSEVIEKYHVPKLAGAKDLEVPEGWAKELLKDGRALVMFDGFDEVAKVQRPAVARWLNEQMQQYGDSVFILTSRPKAYREQDASTRLVLASSLWVRDFDEGQRRNFVTGWYGCQERYANAGRDTPDVKKQAAEAASDLLRQIEENVELKTLAKNPLLLNMIVTFHRRYQGANLPKRRVELYREICQLQLKDRPRARQLYTLLAECEAQTVLQQVAFEMIEKKLERVEHEQLLELVKAALSEQEEVLTARAFLESVVEVSELIVFRDEEYEFAHLSFQEYLAAAYVAAKPERVALLYEHLAEDWWKPTILLYAGLVNPTKLIREAMARGANSFAYECLQETRKRVDSVLKAALEANLVTVDVIELERVVEQVQDARYADLERYLKNGEWQDADDETYRLMITEIGKEEGQSFASEDLLDFPCEPLKVIDRLWVKHSDGKFGFSIQKDLYIECGGVPDGKYCGETYDKFCELNGWRVQERWTSVKFHISSPKGHLPVVGWGYRYSSRWRSRRASISSLSYRLVKCDL